MMSEQPTTTRLDRILDVVRDEVHRATQQFPSFNTAHEGYAVLLEEVDELWEAVKLNQKRHPERDQRIRDEAVQVAAMACRVLLDCCITPRDGPWGYKPRDECDGCQHRDGNRCGFYNLYRHPPGRPPLTPENCGHDTRKQGERNV